MKENRFSTLLKLLFSISALAILPSAAENGRQQQVPHDAKEFRMDTWKYQEKFDFPDEENEGPWKQVH